MSRPDTRVKIAFDLAAGGSGDFFTLNDSIKGVLDGVTYKLAGEVLEDVTAEVQNITVRRGRSRELERFQAGAATVTLDNSQRKYDPTAGTAITPYGLGMRPRKEVQIESNGIVVFNGVVDDWDLDYALKGDHTASVKVTDGFVFLAGQNIDPHATSAQTTGERIAAILDRPEIAWPEGKRAIDTGVATLQADVIGGTADPKPEPALAYLQQVDTAEQGAFFVGGNGTLTFRSRQALQVSTDVVFADDGTGVPFTDIAASYGSEELRNHVTVSRLNGGTVTAVGTASVAAYGVIDYELRDVLLADDTQAQTLADVILDRYQEPLLRIDSVEVNMNGLTSVQQGKILSLDLGSLVRVVYTPSGIGDAIEQFVSVDSIEHDIDSQEHRVRFDFSQGDPPALILDSLLFGILDSYSLGY